MPSSSLTVELTPLQRRNICVRLMNVHVPPLEPNGNMACPPNWEQIRKNGHHPLPEFWIRQWGWVIYWEWSGVMAGVMARDNVRGNVLDSKFMTSRRFSLNNFRDSYQFLPLPAKYSFSKTLIYTRLRGYEAASSIIKSQSLHPSLRRSIVVYLAG